jgi:hypothetical protein
VTRLRDRDGRPARRALVVTRRVLGFDVAGVVSLVLWVARRRHGVPRGATAVTYARAQTPTMALFLFVMVVELVLADVLLRALDAPESVRVPILLVDAYGVLIGVAATAAGVTRPHVVTHDEVRVRWGAFLDVRLPRDRVVLVRRVRNLDESGHVRVDGDTLVVAVAAQTNVVLDLDEPVTVVRPLGREAEVRRVRFFADDPDLAVRALRNSIDPRVLRG